MRRRTAMLNRDVLSAWSHTGPRTAIPIENRVISCCNCGKNHTANYGGCPVAPKPKIFKHNKFAKQQPTDKPVGKDEFPPLKQGIRQPARAVIISNTRSAGGESSSCPPPAENQWKKPRSWVNRDKVRNNKGTSKSQLNSTGTAASVLGEDKNTIMSILQVVRTAEVSELAAKFRKAKHGVDRLRIILENQDLIISVYLPLKKELLQSDLKILFALGDAMILIAKILTGTATIQIGTVGKWPDILDVALMKGLALRLNCIEILQCLHSDHRPVLMKLDSLTGNCLPLNKTITNWQKVLTVLEEIDTPILNNIPNDIVSTDNIDYAICSLTNHIRTVVDNNSRVVPAKSDRKELPSYISELIRAKNAALLRTAKALKTEGAIPVSALRKPDKSVAFDDREKVKCLADSNEQQCSENPLYDPKHVQRVEEEVSSSLPTTER
ncbi:hypothetical protein EVAR_39314_1 [Eumeta japonica]|uniref:Uncharacterized protein n=1 Tax=Eumeta variegata TaxID=151549 RepID=A0A4C1VVJ6_EUMVA|nr:hypothetical protein EVAR_39314_1 [Eumeta japonica]